MRSRHIVSYLLMSLMIARIASTHDQVGITKDVSEIHSTIANRTPTLLSGFQRPYPSQVYH
ncbi:hypothetical protein [Candidatus Nitrosocosmicus sp. FF01]|uniref:hypothetical protein n=1 Tax=Candidatus Nitrosocosmicus sp. FF01 TaxID=3397670 RepID=UPI0039ED1541